MMLKNLIIKLYEITNKQDAGTDICSIIDEMLEENDLAQTELVPEWFVYFIQAVIDEKETDKVFFTVQEKQGDIDNFILDLEAIVEMQCNDYGEAIAIDFSTIDMHALISREGDYYEVKRNKVLKIS